MGLPVVVVTHEPPADWPPDTPFTFVTDGIEAAISTAEELEGPISVAEGRDVTHLRYRVRR